VPPVVATASTYNWLFTCAASQFCACCGAALNGLTFPAADCWPLPCHPSAYHLLSCPAAVSVLLLLLHLPSCPRRRHHCCCCCCCPPPACHCHRRLTGHPLPAPPLLLTLLTQLWCDRMLEVGESRMLLLLKRPAAAACDWILELPVLLCPAPSMGRPATICCCCCCFLAAVISCLEHLLFLAWQGTSSSLLSALLLHLGRRLLLLLLLLLLDCLPDLLLTAAMTADRLRCRAGGAAPPAAQSASAAAAATLLLAALRHRAQICDQRKPWTAISGPVGGARVRHAG